MNGYEFPAPPPEPPPDDPPPTDHLTQHEVICTTEPSLVMALHGVPDLHKQDCPSLCQTSTTDSSDTPSGWNIPDDLHYYSDYSDDSDDDGYHANWNTPEYLTTTVKTVVNKLFTMAAHKPSLRQTPILFPEENTCFEPCTSTVKINDSNDSLKLFEDLSTNVTLQGYDFETNTEINKTKTYKKNTNNTKTNDPSWTNWYGHTKIEEEDIFYDSQVHTTETICDHAMEDLTNMLANENPFNTTDSDDEYDLPHNLTLQDPESHINDIIDTISYSSNPTQTLTKKQLQKIYNNGDSENITMKVRKENHDKMMDGGANRNITNRREILRRYKKLKYQIPVSGVAAGGPACYIDGYGYIDILTEEGHTIETLVYYFPHCSSTILSPNAIVAESKGKFTGWLQCSHMDLHKGNIIFFNRHHKKLTSTISTTSTNKLWYIIQPKNTMMKKAGSRNEMYYERKYDRAYANKMTVGAQYELWHQRCLHPGETVMTYLPECVDGVPRKLSTFRNHFHKCGSCMPAKATKPSGNATELPKTKISGERFHFDYGFIRSEQNQAEGIKDIIVRSWDGYNSYLIIVDKHTRYTWVFLSKNKNPPIDTIDKFLDMHGIPNTPDTEKGLIKLIRTDGGGELAGCDEFKALCNKKGYSVQTTAADSSSQNGIVERPNETIGNMMRSSMHSAGLPGKYWSDILLQVVYIKNKLPHKHFKYKSTPQTEFTGILPDFSNLRIPGSLVTVRKPGRRSARLSNHTYDGIFLRYNNTMENCIYVDRKTNTVKNGRIKTFDEAHFSAKNKPPGPQQLFDLGVRNEPVLTQTTLPVHIHDPTQQIASINKPNKKLLIKLTHEDAVPPIRSSPGAAGYDLCNCEDVTIQPGGVGCVNLGIQIHLPEGTYGRIAPRQELSVQELDGHTTPYIDVMAGVIDEDFRDTVKVVLHNLHTEPVTIPKRTRIAQLILENIQVP